MAVIGVLLAVLLPAMVAAREAARRVECTNHLKQLGVALHCYHDVHNSLPAAWQYERSGKTAYGWAVALLPFVDQRPLFDATNRDICLTNDRQAEFRVSCLPLFRCPSDVAAPLFDLSIDPTHDSDDLPLALANYIGVYGTSEPDDIRPTPEGDGSFVNTRPVRFAEFTGGLSNVFVIGERSVATLPSTWVGFVERDEDAQCRIVGEARDGPNCRKCDECEFSSRHGAISQFLWGDGHVHSVSASVDLAVYRRMSQRSQ